METQLKAGGIVLNPLGEVLVVRNHLNRYTFPKGSPEAGESLPEAARREITEESGLETFTLGQEIGILERPGFTASGGEKPTVMKSIHFYLCTTSQQDLQPQADDILEAFWVAQKDLPQVLSWAEELAFFEKNKEKFAL